jgi:hypothetical protein
MKIMLEALTVAVASIAAYEIWRVLRDICKALQTIVEYVNNPDWKLYGVVDALDRIGDILGGILADMPRPASEPQPRSDWDRLRASWGAKKSGAE